MNPSKFILKTSPNRKILEAVDVANRTTDSSQGVSKSQLLLVTISTTVMMALKKPLSKEYYQWTRAYLETIRNEDGTSLPNISKFLKYIDWFEKNQNIDDVLQNTKISLPSDEEIEIIVQEPSEDILQIPDTTILSSTKISKIHQTQKSSTQNSNVEIQEAASQIQMGNPDEMDENDS